jgi:hypothetical protein
MPNDLTYKNFRFCSQNVIIRTIIMVFFYDFENEQPLFPYMTLTSQSLYRSCSEFSVSRS